MRRQLWPTGLIGRVSLVLFAAVLLVVIGSSLIVEQAELVLDGEAQAQRVAEQLDAAGRVLSVTASAQRPLVAQTLSEPDLAFDWPASSPVAPIIGNARRAKDFRAKLVTDQPVLAARQLVIGPADEGEIRLAGDLQLDDGSRLGFRVAPPRASGFGLYRDLAALILLSGCVLLAALLVVRTLAAPLNMLVKATDAIGHGPSIQIEETGPGEIKRVARAFNAMQGRIAKLVTDRTEALAAVSHDLRTPISRMRLRAGFLDRPEDRIAYEDDLAEMEAMLNALLAYLGGENDPETPKRTNIAALLATLVDAASDAGRAATYEGPDHCALMVRALGLKRALSNLLNNALAYGTCARVALSETETGIVITIDDDGPGIAEADMGSVFEPFYRADASRSLVTGGMGLGLSIARQAILREKGSIDLANRPGGGLRASVQIPHRIEG